MPKWEEELEALKRDPSHWDTLSPSMRKSLRTRGLVSDEGQVIETEPEQPDAWRVQSWLVIGDKEDWFDQVSPTGEKLIFPTSDEAERQARQLSLLNPRAFRVVQYTIAGSFVVYDYGQRYLEDGVTHSRTRMEPAVFTEKEGDEATMMYQIESRRIQGGIWEDAPPREYLDMDEAGEAALEISKANLRREYRVVLAQTRFSALPVVYRAGESFPDTDYLATLCAMSGGEDVASALVSLLVLWKGEKPAHGLIREMYGKVTNA